VTIAGYLACVLLVVVLVALFVEGLSKASVAAVAVTLVAVAARLCAPWQAVQQHAVSDLFGLSSLVCARSCARTRSSCARSCARTRSSCARRCARSSRRSMMS
jgi:hypothetical protein